MKAALVFLSANSVKSVGQKLGYGSGSTHPMKNPSLVKNLSPRNNNRNNNSTSTEYSFKNDRLHVHKNNSNNNNNNNTKQSEIQSEIQIPKTTPISDTAIVKDILALELKLAELGTLSLPFSDENQSVNNSIMNKSLLSSFISRRPTSPMPNSNNTHSSGNTGTGGSSPFGNGNGHVNRLLSNNMPSALGESYMFLNENQHHTQAQHQAQIQSKKPNPNLDKEYKSNKSNKSIPYSNAINNHRILNKDKLDTDLKPALGSGSGSGSKEQGTSGSSGTSNTSGGGGSNSNSCGISTAAVENLLGGMKRLEQENFKLLKRIDGLLELERNHDLKQVEIDTFKQDFTEKYEKLKIILNKFAVKYPSLENPVTKAVSTVETRVDTISIENSGVVVGMSMGSSVISQSKSGKESESESEQSKIIIKQLERTLRGTLSRLNKVYCVYCIFV